MKVWASYKNCLYFGSLRYWRLKPFLMKSTSLLIVYQRITDKSKTTAKGPPAKSALSVDFDSKYEDSTPLGKQYQAEIPPLATAPYDEDEAPYLDKETLVWSPYKLSEEVVQKHLADIGITGRRGRHQMTAYDEEMALFELHRSDYDTEEAKRRFLNRPPIASLEDVWCEEDKNLYNIEFKKNGKDFGAIHRVLFWKSIEEIVEYYYVTKKTC
ncbi:mesoderm induction early response protein 1 [Parasteatoda tepidariorum]|uniref:mesoderm induction early response protein 1 n=1 Tax=Parasteatoda tepidariorum TaxID=114398 RepID=UPI00077FA2FA|nr:REST corepressor isoform X2 [Parasteatoda tepidariorum]